MARLNAPSQRPWFDPTEIEWSAEWNQDSAFFRLWKGFMTARIMVALVLLALQIVQYLLAPAGHAWTLPVCTAYLMAALAVRLRTPPSPRGERFAQQWQVSVGLDLLVFALLQGVAPTTVNYIPLLALPVLLASVMGTLTLALGTASAVTFYLLALAWYAGSQTRAETAPAFFQAGLTSMGYFAVAVLASQLSTRLLREEASARRHRQAIRLQTQVNELVIETLSQGVVVIDAHGVVRAANPAALSLLAPRHRVLRVPFALSEEEGWHVLASLAGASFGLLRPQTADLSMQHAGEGERRVHVRTRLTEALDPQAESLCVMFIEDLPELEARLRQEKMLAMGRMSAAVAHEIRNPLAAITQANALLAEELADPAHLRLAAMVEQNARRLARIVEDVLNVARVPQPSGEAQPQLWLDEAVERITLDWCTQNGTRDRLLLLLNADGCSVIFDAEHLRQVMVNLLDNAARYSGQAADAMVVSTCCEALEGPLGERMLVSLRVWSDGEPLAPTVQEHLFEPFFSSESRSSGLGLYICRELCERHGAKLGYARELARGGQRKVAGNCFFVDLECPGADQHPGTTHRLVAMEGR